MWAHADLPAVLAEHMQWQEAQRLVRHTEGQAKADANLEVAWLAADAAERKAREAAGAAAYDAEAARRARRNKQRMPVGGFFGGAGLGGWGWLCANGLFLGWGVGAGLVYG